MTIPKLILLSCMAFVLFCISPDVLEAQEGDDEGQPSPIARLHFPDAFPRIEWSPDGTRLAVVAWPDIHLLDTSTWETALTIADAQVSHVAWHPNGGQFASVRGGRSETLLIWDAENGEILLELDRSAPRNDGVIIIDQLSWSPDGDKIASNSAFDTILIWDLLSSEITAIPDKPIYHGTQEILWSPDVSRLATGGTDGTLRLWDVTTGENEITVPGFKHVSWHPDGKLFAGANFENTVSIWNATTGENYTTLHGHTENIISLAWHPDGDWLASTGLDNMLIVWDVKVRDTIEVIRGDFHELAWHPDGTKIATSSVEEVVVWSFEAE